MIYKTKGDYEKAIKYLEQSLKIRREIGDKDGEGRALNNIGKIYRAKTEYNIALEYLKQSLKIRQSIGDTYGLAENLNNIGAIFFKQNRAEEAIPLLMQAYQIFKETGSPNTSYPLEQLGAIILQIGEARFQEIVARMK